MQQSPERLSFSGQLSCNVYAILVSNTCMLRNPHWRGHLVGGDIDSSTAGHGSLGPEDERALEEQRAEEQRGAGLQQGRHLHTKHKKLF